MRGGDGAFARLLEAYIDRQPAFTVVARAPSISSTGAPEIARGAWRRPRRACGGRAHGRRGRRGRAGVRAEARSPRARSEAIVENGGDIWIASPSAVTVGLYAGEHPLSGRLALRIPPERLPVSVCSSSGRFGHSLSFGDCDLATVVARDGALADAAATLAGELRADRGRRGADPGARDGDPRASRAS